MSTFVASQFTAAAGAFLFGLLACFPSLLVRAENRGLDGFVADFAGVVCTAGLYLLSLHLFASGRVEIYTAAAFIAGLAIARLVFRRLRPFLAKLLAPALGFVAEKRKRIHRVAESLHRKKKTRSTASESRYNGRNPHGDRP